MRYCLQCKKDTKDIDLKVLKTKNDRKMLLSKCAICGNKKLRFLKEQEIKALLSSLGIKIPLLSKMPILGDALF